MLAGGLAGLAIGSGLPQEYRNLAQAAIGVGTVGIGIKMLLSTANVLIPVGSLIIGGLLGHLIGLQAGMDSLGALVKAQFGAGSATFQEAFVTPSILYCVGPMTLLGCLQDGLEGDFSLLALKSVLDGVSSVFFAAALGPGALLAAGTVLAVQIPLTLGARKLRFLLERRHMADEISAAGGLILVAIGLDLLRLKDLPSADFLPALILAAAASRLWPPK